VNRPDEAEPWVSFDGVVTNPEEGGFELAEQPASRYGDLSDAERRSTLELWRRAAAALRVLELVPARIRTYED
jgi:hypothetical protein